MYRALTANHEVRRAACAAHAPALRVARAPRHQPEPAVVVDITKLKGPTTWSYFSCTDVFSRCVVGWMLAPNERRRVRRSCWRSSRRSQRRR
jgi:putative transposase